MILTVALNATVNVSYEAAEIAWGAPNHISRMSSRAGGGSLAIARVLAGLGEDVLVAGFAGGGGGDLIEADLARAGVATAFTRIGRESRRVIEVLDEAREESTRLSEPAPFITTEELGRFAAEFRQLLPGLDAVVLSGGLAAGLPLDMYASLASYAAEASVPAIVHAGGPVLWRALDRHPALVLIASTGGVPGAGVSESPAALLARGSRAAVMLSGAALLAAAGPGPEGLPRPGPEAPAGPGADLPHPAPACPAPAGPGPEGLRGPAPAAPGPAGQWRAALEGYPGLSLSAEAVVAGLLPAVTQGWSWPDALRHAVALGATADLLGQLDLDAYDLLSSEVVLSPAGEPPPA